MSSCNVNLLSDEPAEEDLFGPHEQVAEAIAEMVTTESGKKAIALEGTWGSGKSTTVQLLRQALEKAPGEELPPATVFNFDAWAHSGDPLRRSFIEKLETHLVQIGWIEEDDWEDEIKELRQKTDETTITSTPRLTPEGMIMVLMLFLVPLGYALYTSSGGVLASLLSLVMTSGRAGTLASIIGVVFILLPAAYAVWLWWRDSSSDEDDNEDCKQSSGDGDNGEDDDVGSEILALFLNKVRTEEESTKLRTPDPTSIEFRKLFSGLMCDAVGGTERQIVVAIDNLDRIEADEALTIWATMRTFFEFSAEPDESWLEQFWLLVPYDRDSLRKLWYEELPGSTSSQNGESTQGPQLPDETAEAFIQKSFQVRFRVTPPVLSDWREYFSRQFKRAFPDHTDDRERHKIEEIYNRSRDNGRGGTTPRDIILFLNQLGALHRQWGDDPISLEEQVLFVAFREEIKPDSNLSAAEFLPDDYRRHRNTAQLARHMAALYYNVAPDKALQVLMGEPVERALSEGNASELEAFVGAPGLGEVVTHTVSRELTGGWSTDPNALALSASVIDSIEDELHPAEAQYLWERYEQALPHVEDWEGFQEDAAYGIARIIEHAPLDQRDGLVDEVLESISGGCPDEDEESFEQRLQDWVRGGVEFLAETGSISEVDEPRTLVVPGKPDIFLRVIRQLRLDNQVEQYHNRFPPEADSDEILGAVEHHIDEGSANEALLRDIKVLASKYDGWDWTGVGTATALALRHDREVDDSALAPLVLLLEQLASIDAIPGDHLRQQVEDGHLYHRLHQARQAGVEVAEAACIHSIFIHNPAGTQSGNRGNANAGQQYYMQVHDTPEDHAELVDEVAHLIQQFGYTSRLLDEDAFEPDATALKHAVLKTLLQRDEAPDYISASNLISSFSVFRQAVEEQQNREEIWRRYAARGTLLEALQNGYTPRNAGDLHLEIVQALPRQADFGNYPSFLQKELFKLEEQEWEQELRDEGPLFRLLLAGVERGWGIEMPVVFQKALVSHFAAACNGDIQPGNPEKWVNLLEVLKKSHRNVFPRRVLNKLIPADKKTPGIRLYGDVLLEDQDALPDRPDDVVTTLIPDLLEEKQAASLEWVRDLVEQRHDVVEKASESAQETLRDQLRSQLQTQAIHDGWMSDCARL